MKSIGDINKLAKSYALGGAKIPHGISNPVLRRIKDKVAICYFVYAYSRENMESKQYPRPCEWLELDIEDGTLIARNDCSQIDFSAQSGDSLYSLAASADGKATLDTFRILDMLFDTVRASIVFGGKMDLGSYKGYMKKLLGITPSDYRVFYEELSNMH